MDLYLDSMKLEERVAELRYKKSETIFNEVDNIFIYIFKKARSSVEANENYSIFKKEIIEK